ncbi:shikimate dehydrogenase [Mangrovicoccus algicola]|uniref:Shikimate dehydrogenase (NADP(+)) n=1 Tax=Mangrovicoccus algicola TaxID=2771008 RepID=A0A8J6YXI8_9RHOB|nr:shikimate dehydrogenase [Mangrovicoccus algicola]MBE3638269.1 shikimate dehydrogenase [Mangrovicoccus algicola]
MSLRIPLAGVIGNPIGHSKSPRMHGHWLARQGIAGHYIPMEVEPADLASVLETLPRAGFAGVNVTIPHKEAALAGARRATPRARAIGAANTLTFLPGGGYEADNTDGYGFHANLAGAAEGWQAQDGPVAVFGAGGAARAILHAMLEAGAPEIRLMNRTRARAEGLATAFGPRVRVLDWGETDAALKDAATVVNTTSLGMAGQPAFDLDLSAMRPGMLATDIVYTPLETPFLQAAARRGAQVVDGLGMLLWQGVPGFNRWFGGDAQVTADLRALMLAP